MEEFLTAIIVAGVFYAILRLFKVSWLKQGFPPSFIYLAGVFAWFAILAVIAALYSFVSMTIDLASAFDTDTLIPFVIILIVLGIAAKLLADKKEILDISHMTPFLRSAVLFQSYDARRQELVERNERWQIAQAQKAAAERAASGEPEEEMDVSEDAGMKSEGPAAVSDASKATTELDLLKRGEGVDISEMFTSNTAQLPTHPLYQHISSVRIDPSDKLLSFRIVLPASATEPELTPEKLQRVKQGMYQVFQTLVIEQWLKPLAGFFTSVKTVCFRVRKDEFDMTREIMFMSIQMPVNQILQHRGKPFNSAEFEKIATINMEG